MFNIGGNATEDVKFVARNITIVINTYLLIKTLLFTKFSETSCTLICEHPSVFKYLSLCELNNFRVRILQFRSHFQTFI